MGHHGVKVIIDTDPGIDDAIAILYALAVPEFEIAAITTVAGNIGLTLGLLSFGGAGTRELALSAAATIPTYIGLWLGQVRP